ncbi:MAG: protein kinase domain-containing protein [Solirubrobacteraceae bacterium]
MSVEELFAGRYRVERRLGVGGMSTVQLAFDTRLERYVAVKLLAEHLAADDGFVARFRREALAAARLVHPNVVQVYDFGTENATGRQFIAMEYVEGNSGAEMLREQGRLPPREVVEICAQACRGLDYAHRNGVVHRDIKPGNILRNPEGIVKIADFGIAKAADDSDITRVGSVIGTAAYLAPEQARGEPAGPASDLSAPGVVASQLVAERLPYQGASLTELARQQESGPPTDITQVVPDVSPALSAAIMRALVADPARRYASAPDMERALRDGLRGVAPAPSEGATVALGGSGDATRAMPPQTRSHQPLEPLYEDEPPRRRAPVAVPERREASPDRRRNLAVLALVAVLVAALVFGAIYLNGSSGGPQTSTFGGDLQQTLDDLRGAIGDNTR